MNSRRHILQFFGLGTLVSAATSVAPSQSRAVTAPARAVDTPSIFYAPSRIADTVPRTTFSSEPLKWVHRVIYADKNDDLAEIMDRETADDIYQFCSISMLRGGWVLVFRKRVLWSA